MHYPTDRIAHTTAFVTPVVEHCGSTMKDRSDDPLYLERTIIEINNNIIAFDFVWVAIKKGGKKKQENVGKVRKPIKYRGKKIECAVYYTEKDTLILRFRVEFWVSDINLRHTDRKHINECF